MLRNTVIRGEATPFVMELPPYRLPTLKGLLIHTWERAWQYAKKAGTVILAISILIWAFMTFPALPPDISRDFEIQRAAIEAAMPTAPNAEDTRRAEALSLDIDNREAEAGLRNSYAGRLGTALESVTRLAGFDWRTNIALLGGFAAKEVIVSTLGTAYAMGSVDAESSESLGSRLRKDPRWNRLTALSVIIFVMLYAPCFVTVVAMARESSWGWAVFSMTYTTLLAFGLSTAVYQVGSRFFPT